MASPLQGQRKSIGLANLVDASPRPTQPQERVRRKRRPPGVSVALDAAKDGDSVSAASPTTGIQVATEVPTHEPVEPPPQPNDSEEDDGDEADEANDGEEETPATSRGSTVLAATLFESIAQDAFFEVMTRLGVELCASDDAASRRAPASAVNVNGFRDATHGKTLLHEACRHARLQVIKCLLFHGASPMHLCNMGRSPFHDVVSAGRRDHALEAIQTLYEYEPRGLALVDTNGTHLVHLAAIHGCLDVLQWLAGLADAPVALSITSFSGRNVLHYAAYNGRLAVLEWLLQDAAAQAPSIASLDVNGYSVLHYAAMGGHLDVCQWLVYCAPSRRDLNIVGTNSGGSTPLDLAKQPEIQAFFEEVSQVPDAPSDVQCIGTDSSSMGITWTFESTIEDCRLRDELAPKWFEIEYCKKPTGLRRASAMLSMLMILPSEAASAAAISASSYLLDWDTLDVFIQPESNEHWLTGLESDCEYLVRMRTLNRNGYSEYSVPSLSGEFKTTASNTSADGSTRKPSFFDLLTPAPPRRLEMAFMGTLDLEILEARRLLNCSTVSSSPLARKTRQGAADQGRFFGVVTLQLPVDECVDAPPRRRTSLSIFKSDREDGNSTAASTDCAAPRCLYRMRTEVASVQQDLLLAGSLNAFRHPQFDLRTKLRIPEALDSELILEIHHETASAHASVIGVARVPLVELVRGFPAKMQWLTLEHGDGDGSITNECDDTHGELLIRSLFRADGVTSLPHPTKPGVMCTTAEELLDESTGQSAITSSTTYVSTSSSSASSSPTSVTSVSPEPSPTTLVKTPTESVEYDALGFRIWPTHEVPLLRTYEYYRLHQRTVAQQQESLWLRYHREKVNIDAKGAQARSLMEALHHGNDQAEIYEAPGSRNDSRLRRLVWNGIPPSSRGALYMRMSGALRKRLAAGDGYYQQQLQRALALKTRGDADTSGEAVDTTKFDVACRQIQVDLKRTLAGNQSWINSSEGEAALERVLLTYAIHNERIGYCQSMSFIAGRLLCMLHDIKDEAGAPNNSSEAVEEDVFWLIAALCEDYFPTNYTKGMEGLHVDGLVLEKLLQQRLPKVKRHFQVVLQNPPQMGLLLVTGWLLPAFCAVFPSETSARLLDVLFYEGSGVVFALILTFLRMAQPQMIHETTDYMQLFRLLKDRDQRLHDTALLMEIALDEHLLLENAIPTLRLDCKAEYETARRTQELAQLQQQHEIQRKRSGISSTTTYF